MATGDPRQGEREARGVPLPRLCPRGPPPLGLLQRNLIHPSQKLHSRGYTHPQQKQGGRPRSPWYTAQKGRVTHRHAPSGKQRRDTSKGFKGKGWPISPPPPPLHPLRKGRPLACKDLEYGYRCRYTRQGGWRTVRWKISRERTVVSASLATAAPPPGPSLARAENARLSAGAPRCGTHSRAGEGKVSGDLMCRGQDNEEGRARSPEGAPLTRGEGMPPHRCGGTRAAPSTRRHHRRGDVLQSQ